MLLTNKIRTTGFRTFAHSLVLLGSICGVVALSFSEGANAKSLALLSPPPVTQEKLDAAFQRANDTLSRHFGRPASIATLDKIAVPASCRDQLDYFAQQVLWMQLFHPEEANTAAGLINCNTIKRYNATRPKTQ
jgi:hypothetical protein